MIKNTKRDDLITAKIDIENMLKNEFCICMAGNLKVRSEIDKIFNKNKLEYLKAYKSSPIYKSRATEFCMADTARYTEKVIGIVEKGLSENNYENILNLYKKAYKKIYNNTKSIPKVSIRRDVGKYVSLGYEGNDEILSTIYVYKILDKLEDFESEVYFISELIRDIYIANNYSELNFSKESINNHIEDIKKSREYLGLSKRSYTAEDLIQTIIKRDMERYNKSKILTPHEMTTNSTYIEKVGEIGRYVGSMEGLFKYLGINTSTLFKDTIFSSFEIDQMLFNYTLSIMFNSFKDEDRGSYLVFTIYISTLNKAYTSLKNNYLKLVNEDYLVEIDKLESKLHKSISEANKEKEAFKEKEANYKKREEDLLAKIERLEKENSRLKQEIEENKDLKQEVIKLRNLVFDESDTDDVAVTQEDVDIDILNDKNVVILGGNQSWVNDMKKVLPNATFAGIEARNTNLGFINKNSLVFINTKMKHSFYYKIKSVIEKLGIDYFYINSGSNIDISLFTMSKSLNNLDK